MDPDANSEPSAPKRRRADMAHMVFITWIASSYGFMPLATFLHLVQAKTSDAEMVLVYVGWLAFMAVTRELWSNSLGWATDPASGFTGEFLWFSIYWLEATFDAFFLLQIADGSAWFLWGTAIVCKSFLRDSGIYWTLSSNSSSSAGSSESADAELRTLLRDLPPKLRRFSKAAFADCASKMLVACLLALEILLDKLKFGTSMLKSKVYTAPEASTETQFFYFVLLLNIQVLMIKMCESYLARSHARLVPLLQKEEQKAERTALEEKNWKEEYYHLLDNKNWSFTLSTPDYWSEYYGYSIAVACSITHRVLLSYLLREPS